MRRSPQARSHRSYRRLLATLVAAGLAVPLAHAQVHQVALTTTDTDDFGSRNTDASLGVNNSAIVVTTNMRMSMFSKSGGPQATFQVGDTGWPFTRIDSDTTLGPSRFFDPQTEYAPNSGRLLMVYSEDNVTGGSGALDISALHLAISKDPAVLPSGGTLSNFSTNQWWYYTGPTGNPGNGGSFIDLKSAMTPYRSGAHGPIPAGETIYLVDKPQMSIDEQAIYISTVLGGDIGQAMVIIPTEHGTGGSLSILGGDKPAPGDMTFVRFKDLTPSNTMEYCYLVQEPRLDNGFANAQFVISLVPAGGEQDSIRLGGLWYDANAIAGEEWVYRQRLTTGGAIEDLDVGSGYEFYSNQQDPETPDDASTCDPTGRSTDWQVHMTGSFFASAVLVRDANNNARIFATHHVNAVGVSPSFLPEERTVVQWYVIDPDLSNFRGTGDGWDPEVLITGRMDSGTGNRYHPVIAVSPQGVAYIEYTYSDDSTFPQIRRALLSSNYTSVASDTLVQAGPDTAYIADDFSSSDNGGWADFADMQSDPDGCGFWSVHTLVTDTDTSVCQVNARSVWLFELAANCENANLNFDGGVDVLDMALFNDLYSTGARRVDMNVDGTTDATDAILYQSTYDAATRP